jgi:hypothetical protein
MIKFDYLKLFAMDLKVYNIIRTESNKHFSKNSCFRIAFFCLLMLSVADLSAQIKAGYKFGLNLSTVSLKTDRPASKPEMPPGVHAGAIVDIPLNNTFSFQPGFVFSAKGSNFTIDSVDLSLSPVYIEIPLNAVCTLGSHAVKFMFFAGPYFAVGIGGYKLISGGELNNINYGSSEKSDLKTCDFGFNIGTGVNINGFLISAQYGFGLTNLASSPDEMRNKVIGISISSLVAGKQP